MGISSPVGLDENDTRLTRQGARRRAAPSRAATALRLLQWLLLVTGGMLLVVHAAAQVDGDAAVQRELPLYSFMGPRSNVAPAATDRQ